LSHAENHEGLDLLAKIVLVDTDSHITIAHQD